MWCQQEIAKLCSRAEADTVLDGPQWELYYNKREHTYDDTISFIESNLFICCFKKRGKGKWGLEIIFKVKVPPLMLVPAVMLTATEWLKPFLSRDRKDKGQNCFALTAKEQPTMWRSAIKLHGYPGPTKQWGRSRPFKGASSAWGEQEAQTEPVVIPVLPGINQEQPKQLFQFLTNLTAGGEQKQSMVEATASATHMAVITQVLSAVHCFMGFESWILDTQPWG